jgi:MtN3 and saliva related transmembrane protein
MDFITSVTPTDIIGTSAAVMTTAAMFPQAIKIIRTRDVKSISLWMYVTNTIGIVLWGSYGVLLNQKPIIYANLIAIIPAVTILIFKLLIDYENNQTKEG